MKNTRYAEELTWYAIYTRARAEKKAMAALQERQVEAWLPVQKSVRLRQGKKIWQDKPLIPSYVFVHLAPRQHDVVRFTPGISNIVSFHGSAIPVTEKEVQWLRLLEGHAAEVEQTGEVFAEGDKVEVIAGPFRSMQGTLCEVRQNTRLAVTIDSLHHTFLLKIDARWLKKLPARNKIHHAG